MGTAAGMLAEARRSLGIAGRPNVITREYATRHGADFLRASWCDMAVTYWARHSGNEAVVLPDGQDRAFTVWHAQDFQRVGRWFPGTVENLIHEARPGDVIFFDWGATNQVGAIDHVGVVEKVLGAGRVQTIEGNTSDACKRRVRAADVIAGFGRPTYSDAPSGGSSATKEDPLIGLKKGDTGEAVKGLQQLIVYAGQSIGEAGVDGDYGDSTAKGLLAVRKSVGSEARAGYGDVVTGIAYAQLVKAVARKESG